jgi:hypothetical protein
MGMTTHGLPNCSAPSGPRLVAYGCVGLTVTAVLFICIPWLAHHFSPTTAMGSEGLFPKQDEALVFGGQRVSGFLVLQDGVPLRNDIPSIHLAEFDSILRQSQVQSYQELIHPVTPPLPFGFVFTPRVEKHMASGILYIVPPEVIERRDVSAWHFTLKRWGKKLSGYGEYWFYVTHAEPLR